MTRRSTRWCISAIGLSSLLSCGPVPQAENTVTPPAAAVARRPVTLVDQGVAKAWIVTSDNPTEAATEAATVLQHHILQSSKARLRIVKESALGEISIRDRRITAAKAPANHKFLLVGKSELTKRLRLDGIQLNAGGIVIRTFPNSIAIFGKDDDPKDPWGTHYAATVFLEEALGVIYLWPGQSGKVIPKRASIRAAVTRTHQPPIGQRRIRGAGSSPGSRNLIGLKKLGIEPSEFEERRKHGMNAPGSDWWRWQRLGGDSGITGGHSFQDLWKTHGKKNLDWFAENLNGNRDQSISPQRSRLHVTHPELLEHIVDDRIAMLDRDPDRISVPVGPNDGGKTSFCMCNQCRALDHPNAAKRHMAFHERVQGKIVRTPYEYKALSDRYVWFYNQIAREVGKKHPHAYVVGDAYGAYLDPPLRRVPRPNVAIRFAGLSYMEDEHRQNSLKAWKGWSAITDTMILRSNHLLGGRRVGAAQNFAHHLARDYRLFARTMVGADLDSIAHHWSTAGLNYYVTARLLWDPYQNVDDLLDRYMKLGFGKAARPMGQYFRRIEEISRKVASLPHSPPEGQSVFGNPGGRIYGHIFRPLVPYTQDVVDELRALLVEARSRANGDRALLNRIAFVRTGLEWTSLQSRLWRATDVDDPRALSIANKWLAEMMRIFKRQHYAVNVAVVAWTVRNPWEDLGFKWPGL